MAKACDIPQKVKNEVWERERQVFYNIRFIYEKTLRK